MGSKGNILGVPLRRGVSDSSFIDQIGVSNKMEAISENILPK